MSIIYLLLNLLWIVFGGLWKMLSAEPPCRSQNKPFVCHTIRRNELPDIARPLRPVTYVTGSASLFEISVYVWSSNHEAHHQRL